MIPVLVLNLLRFLERELDLRRGSWSKLILLVDFEKSTSDQTVPDTKRDPALFTENLD
jgi:hypothetical protein